MVHVPPIASITSDLMTLTREQHIELKSLHIANDTGTNNNDNTIYTGH